LRKLDPEWEELEQFLKSFQEEKGILEIVRSTHKHMDIRNMTR